MCITYTACIVTGGIVLPKGAVAATDVDGVKPYASIGVTHDDNLFRLSEDADTVAQLGRDERSDTYRTLEAGIDLRARVSRQRLNAHASVNQTRYSRYSFLDHEGGAARLRWDWTVGSDWYGRLGYDYSRSLASLDTQEIERNLRADQRAYVEGDYRFSARWRARFGLQHRDLDNSAESKAILDTNATSAEAELHRLSAPADGADADPNYLGVRARFTDGDYPNPETIAGTVVDNSFEETEAGLVAGWRFPAQSRAQAFVGYTERRYGELPERDFDGATGRASFDWQVGTKTVLHTAAWRELTIADDQSASYVVAEGAHIGPDWEMTPKLTFKARAGRETRDYRGDPRRFLIGTEKRVDRLETIRLALEYEPVPTARIGLSWKTGTRESNRPLADYRYHAIAATLRASF